MYVHALPVASNVVCAVTANADPKQATAATAGGVGPRELARSVPPHGMPPHTLHRYPPSSSLPESAVAHPCYGGRLYRTSPLEQEQSHAGSGGGSFPAARSKGCGAPPGLAAGGGKG